MNKSALVAALIGLGESSGLNGIGGLLNAPYVKTGRTRYTTTNKTRENARRLRQMQRPKNDG